MEFVSEHYKKHVNDLRNIMNYESFEVIARFRISNIRLSDYMARVFFIKNSIFEPVTFGLEGGIHHGTINRMVNVHDSKIFDLSNWDEVVELNNMLTCYNDKTPEAIQDLYKARKEFINNIDTIFRMKNNGCLELEKSDNFRLFNPSYDFFDFFRNTELRMKKDNICDNIGIIICYLSEIVPSDVNHIIMSFYFILSAFSKR